MLPSEKDSRQNQDLVIQSVRELMGGKYVDPEKFAKEPTSAEAEALRLLDFNTGKFAQNYVNEQENPDPRVAKAMGGFSQEKFREAVQSVEEPTQKRNGVLENIKQFGQKVLDKPEYLLGPHLTKGLSNLGFLGKVAAEISPSADIRDMKNFSASTMDNLEKGNIPQALADFSYVAASIPALALPISVGKVKKGTDVFSEAKKADENKSFEQIAQETKIKNQEKQRVPKVQEAAISLRDKLITKAEYDEIVEAFQPIIPITEMPKVTSPKGTVAVLGNKGERKGVIGWNKKLAEYVGKRVSARLDIPAYKIHNVWAVTLHEGITKAGKAAKSTDSKFIDKKGPVIGYAQTAVLKDVFFTTDVALARKIATKEMDKATIGRMNGIFQDVSPENAYDIAQKELNNPNSEYIQVGMNPFRHSYFYNKATGQPVVQAEEVIQIGPLVLAKTPKYGKKTDFSDKVGIFKEGGMVNMQNGGILGGDLPPEAIANGNVIQGAPVGEVAVPGGGGPVDDGVPTQLPEGTFVLNAASVEYHGTKHINDLIKKSIRNLVKKGVQITGEDLNPDDDVPVAISNGEYIIPPEVSRDIGIKKLEDMNERGLEYRKKIEEQEKQKVSAQDEAMNSFVGAPIQSEQQMPMQDGGEASPPDEAMPKPPEDTSDLNEGQKAVIEAEMLKRRLQQEFFNRETERQRRMMEEEERDKGMIFNEKSGQFDYMVQAQPTPTPFVDTLRRISPDNLDKPRRIMGDPNNPSVPVRQAAIGGQILPQVQSTLAGAGIGANAFPASPQEAFLNTPITGSVLQNLGNAVPLGAMQQPQQQAGFMQPMAQKKNPEIARFSFADGGSVDWNFISGTEGGQKLQAYVPTKESGVTIATGVDLKTKDANYFRNIGVSEDIIKVFESANAFGASGDEAEKIAKNIRLTKKQASQLDMAVHKDFEMRTQKDYEKAGGKSWNQLNPAIKTILTSVKYNEGTVGPNLLGQAIANDSKAMINNLNNYYANAQKRLELTKNNREELLKQGLRPLYQGLINRRVAEAKYLQNRI